MKTYNGQSRRLRRAVSILLEHLGRDSGFYRFLYWVNDKLEPKDG